MSWHGKLLIYYTGMKFVSVHNRRRHQLTTTLKIIGQYYQANNSHLWYFTNT